MTKLLAALIVSTFAVGAYAADAASAPASAPAKKMKAEKKMEKKAPGCFGRCFEVILRFSAIAPVRRRA